MYEGIDNNTGSKVIVKVLKPIKKMKINREVKILNNLANGTNIISLLDIVKNPTNETYSLVFEYLHNQNFK